METISHFDMLKAMSIPNNFLGRKNDSKGLHMSMGDSSLKNLYTTTTNYLSWTDENGLSYTFINDSAIRNFLEMQGFSEIYGPKKLDAECFDKCGNFTFDEVLSSPYSVEGAGLLYRNLATYMQYCAGIQIDYNENNVEEIVDPYTEIEKMYSIFMSPEIMKAAEENVEGYDSQITGLNLIEQNKQFIQATAPMYVEEECQ